MRSWFGQAMRILFSRGGSRGDRVRERPSLQPERPPRKARRIEVALVPDLLEAQHRRQARRRRFGAERAGLRMRHGRRPSSPPAWAGRSGGPWPGSRGRAGAAIVLPTSALLTGARVDEAGLEARADRRAMKLRVSARLKLPCMPWPCCSAGVGDLDAAGRRGRRSRSERAEVDGDRRASASRPSPFRLIAESGSVPGMAPSASSTKRPLT